VPLEVCAVGLANLLEINKLTATFHRKKTFALQSAVPLEAYAVGLANSIVFFYVIKSARMLTHVGQANATLLLGHSPKRANVCLRTTFIFRQNYTFKNNYF
jgi:hypothetical protein